jgi:hypothetical protein
MKWLASFFIGVVTGIVAAIAGGLVAAGCVDWFHISGREGESAYFVVAIGLLSGIVGFFVGLVLSRFVGGSGGTGFFKGLGASAGGMLGLAGVAGLICWLLADIPPTIHGHELTMSVEIRLPKGSPQPSPDGPGLKYLEFVSSSPFTHAYRARQQGTLEVKEAKLVNGRWVVPGEVFIFTTRGERSIAVPTSEKEAVGFVVEFPAHPPAKKYEDWSEWLPRAMQGKPWPDTQISYRYRIDELLPAPPPPDPAVVAEAEFAALTPDAPLEKWLGFLKYGVAADREQAILKVVEARPADLVKLLRPAEGIESDQAIYAVSKLRVVDPVVVQAMRDIASEIEDQIRKFTAMKTDEAGYYDLGNVIRNRFKSWHVAWWTVHRVSGLDGRPPLEEIVRLAMVKKEDGFMQEVIGDAEAHLGGLTAPAK